MKMREYHFKGNMILQTVTTNTHTILTIKLTVNIFIHLTALSFAIGDESFTKD